MSAEGFQFAVYDLAGGGKIECDTETLEIGSIVSLVEEDDSKKLAPEGPHTLEDVFPLLRSEEHTLEDGRTIVLDDASKVTEIKEADAPTETEEEMAKKKGKMALELDPELVESVEELIKEKMKKQNFEEDLTSLASELIQVIISYDEELEELEEKKEEEEEATEIEDMKKMFNEMSKIVYEMAKTQQNFSSDLKKIPSAKPISQIEFKSEPEVIDPLSARIEAIKNLNK
jgi:hypothetical protein